jgi:hypothetical protein
MAEDGGHGPGARAWRIGGLAVLVVLAVVLARARAAGQPPPPMSAAGSAAEIFLRIFALAVMVTAVVLLLWVRRRQRVVAAAARAKRKKPPVGPPSRRVVIACLIGMFVALGLQLLGNAVSDKKQADTPPPASAQEVRTDLNAKQPKPPGAEEESGIADEIVLVAGMLTLAAIIFVLVRRNQLLEEDDDEPDDEDEAMARAVQAAREAVLDRTITDPREAIVACFAAMEAALADRGGAVAPMEADTPSEVLRRGIEQASLPATAATTLLRLFREARYSTHPMRERDRADADVALGVLLRTLGVPAGKLTGDPR